MSRTEQLLIITKRLIILTLCGLAVVAAIITVTAVHNSKLMISGLVFGCGLIGGFVSIQQRLRKIGDEELELLAQSWFQILLIPIYGAIFAELLFVAFLGHIVQGTLFPTLVYPEIIQPTAQGFNPAIAHENIKSFFTNVDPASGADLAKLIFWSFVAGFSERLVPQIIEKTQSDGNKS
jgi:uncharacterized membrane protein YqgA involved in biofilm formation